MREIAIVAQTTVPAPGGAGAGPATTPGKVEQPFWVTAAPFILLFVLMYVFMFRSKKGQENKRQQMISALKKGDEVQTIGGVFGRVMETRDDRILVKVDESSNTKVWFARSAIHRVVTGDKAEAK